MAYLELGEDGVAVHGQVAQLRVLPVPENKPHENKKLVSYMN